MPTFRAKERRSSNRPGCFGCSGKPGLSEVRERGTGRQKEYYAVEDDFSAARRLPNPWEPKKMWRCRGRKRRAGSTEAQETWVIIWILKSRCCAERTGVGRYRR